MASLVRRVVAAAFVCLLAGTAAPASAQGGPEQLDQIEPEKGKWQVEYFGAFGGDGGQVVEALVAVSDWLVLGVEIEMEGPRDRLKLESLGLVVLVR